METKTKTGSENSQAEPGIVGKIRRMKE